MVSILCVEVDGDEEPSCEDAPCGNGEAGHDAEVQAVAAGAGGLGQAEKENGRTLFKGNQFARKGKESRTSPLAYLSTETTKTPAAEAAATTTAATATMVAASAATAAASRPPFLVQHQHLLRRKKCREGK